MIDSRTLAGLPVFRAVATAGSFSAAAGRLGVTPSAVSQAIRALEGQLGLRLLARTSRSMALTEAGRQLLAEIDAPLARLTEATQSLREADGQVEGVLRITLSRLASEICIQPCLADFLGTYPAIRLELSHDDRLTDIVKVGFDAGIRMRPSLEGDMISLPIGPPLHRSLVASPDYLSRHGRPTRPEDLLGHRLTRFRFPGSQRLNPLLFQRGDQHWELDPTPALVLDDLRAIELVLRAGLVMAQPPRPIVAPAIEAGALVELLPDYAPAPEQFHIYYPSRVLQSARLRAFVDWFARGRRS